MNITGDDNANTLQGTDEGDVISGLGGDDSLYGGDGDDSITGGAGNDTLDGWNGNDTLVGGDGDDLMYGFEGNDLFVGGAGVDRMYGELGDDGFDLNSVNNVAGWIVDGGAGNDSVDLIQGVLQLGTTLPFANIELLDTYLTDFRGTAGSDSYDFRPFNTYSPGFSLPAEILVSAGAGNDTVYASNTDLLGLFFNTINGEAGNDSLVGGLSRDRLDGGSENDTLDGGAGNDTLLGGTGNDSLTGGDGNDTLNGGGGADTALGGAGNDLIYAVLGNPETIVGGSGIDTLDTTAWGGDYLVNLATGATNFAGESFTEMENLVAGSGNDTLIGTAGANSVNGGIGNDSIDGEAGNDSLRGGAGNDTLAGGTGADLMNGGDHDDLYLVDDAGDVAAELFNDLASGVDTVRSTVSYTLVGANPLGAPGERGFGIERLELLGSANLNGSGNAGNNQIVGNTGANRLDGGAGNDALDGGDGADTLLGGGGVDTLIGGAGDDSVFGAFVGSYDGGAGSGDIIDLSGAGAAANGTSYDLGAASFTLAGGASFTGFEHLIGTAGAEGVYGSAAANRIDGRDGDDTLLGLGGNDSLTGGNGDDLLAGGSGNDTLNGGAGADLMSGGQGSDLYRVDSAGDTIAETGSDALDIDVVSSSIGWTLGSQLEQLVLQGSAAINGTGNGLANRLTGNAGANLLDGGAGVDTLVGGAGNDTYVVDVAGDLISETSTLATEIDTVRSTHTRTLGANLENLVLLGSSAINGVGNSLANRLTGNGAANTLSGGAGNDRLDGALGNDIVDGGLGNDTLIGGSGNDSFRFSSVLNAASNVDTLSGFSAVADQVLLDDAVFAGIGPVGALNAAAFRLGSAAGDTSDRIVYNAATGQLFYDSDGSGAATAVLFGLVTPGTQVSAADFVIV